MLLLIFNNYLFKRVGLILPVCFKSDKLLGKIKPPFPERSESSQ